MVLWTIAALSVLVFSFSALVRIETVSTRTFIEAAQSKKLAEAGLERGLFEIFYRNLKGLSNPDDIWRIDGTPYKNNLGDGHYIVSITEESGKININMLSDASGIILRNLLILRGLTMEDADTIVDSLLDWKDSGDSDAHRLHGAESDFYLSLPIPYKARNDDFDTIEELLLVKGMTAEILFGRGEKKGIIDLLTIHTEEAGINVRTAHRDVLASIPGLSEEIADMIINERQLKPSFSLHDVKLISGGGFALAEPFISSDETTHYSIDSAGFSNSGPAGYSIRAVVDVPDNTHYSYLFYKSPGRAIP